METRAKFSLAGMRRSRVRILLGDNIGGRAVKLRPIRFHVLVCRSLNFCWTPLYTHVHLNHVYTQIQLGQNSTPTPVRHALHHRFTALSPNIRTHTIRHANDGCFSYWYLKMRKRKANWIGHILGRNCLLKQVIEGKIKGQIEVTRR